ncbi:MAG: hypothetical protein QOI04_1722 [Verrucomicrobiota bacterium]|jgi:hypothetical protein
MKFRGLPKFGILAALSLFSLSLHLIRAQESVPSVIEKPGAAPAQPPVNAETSPAPESSVEAPAPAPRKTSTVETRSAPIEKSESADEDFGIGRFSNFPVHLAAFVQAGFDDNVLTTNNGHGSSFTSANVVLTYQFGSPRTKLTLSTGAGLTYYFDRPGNSSFDENAFLDFTLSQKATPRLTLGANLHLAYQVEPDFGYNIGPDRRSGNYFYTQDKFTAAYLWTPRFSTVTSYTPGIVRYDRSAIAAFEDRFENTLGNEFRFLVQPATALVAEYRYEIISYDSAARDSTTHFVLGGFDHNFNPRLLLAMRGGEQFRSSDFGGDHTDPYFEGNLSYAFGHNSISFTNRYSIEEPNVSTTAIRNTFRTGLVGKYGFTPKFSSSFSFYYQHSDNQAFNSGGITSPGFLEQSVDLGFALRYAITRVWSVQAGYNHTQIISDLAGRDYSRNRYFAGAGLTF